MKYKTGDKIVYEGVYTGKTLLGREGIVCGNTYKRNGVLCVRVIFKGLEGHLLTVMTSKITKLGIAPDTLFEM